MATVKNVVLSKGRQVKVKQCCVCIKGARIVREVSACYHLRTQVAVTY
jgi:hypothetical protein